MESILVIAQEYYFCSAVRYPKPTKEQEVLFDVLKGVSPNDLEEIDARILFELFQRHRLFPLAHEVLGLLAPEEKLKWEKTIKSASLKTLHLYGQLQTLIKKLGQEGIGVLPLKGPFLAQTLYGDMGQRHMRDLDLLVISGEILHGVEVMKELGFEPYIPKRKLTPKQWNYYFRHQYDVALKENKSGIIVELHSGIVYPGLQDSVEKALTANLQQVELAGVSTACMSKENTFIYLALHGAHHLFFRLFWLRDLAEVLKRWELDWQEIFNTASELGIEPVVGVSLRLAESYFGLEPPEVWQAYLKEHRHLLSRLENRCHRIILHPRFLSRRNRWNVLLFNLSLRSGYRHRLRTSTSVVHRWYIRKYLSQ